MKSITVKGKDRNRKTLILTLIPKMAHDIWKTVTHQRGILPIQRHF